MNETAGSFELLEPKSPEALAPDPWLETWMMFAAIGLLLLVIAATALLKHRKPPRFDARAARQAAHAMAVAQLQAVQRDSPRDAAVQASLILRNYLAVAAGDPALFETHEEYVSRHQALHAFSDEARAAAGDGFTRLAAMKYAAEIPDTPADEVIAFARRLLDTLHHGFRS